MSRTVLLNFSKRFSTTVFGTFSGMIIHQTVFEDRKRRERQELERRIEGIEERCKNLEKH